MNILINFFNRPEPLARLWQTVRQARPERLFLYQDGPRSDRDLEAIAACRRVVAETDWPCRVERLYQERNYGCDPSGYLAQRWAFSQVERLIVLEDDDVPSPSFYRFCEEMLERYADDRRVYIISGMNHDETTPEAGADYLFTTTFSIWGWASWRRVFEEWDATYAWLDDARAVGRLEALIRERRLRPDFLDICRYHRSTGKPYYESIFRSAMLLGSGLAVVPRANLITNLGAVGEATHYTAANSTLPRAQRRLVGMTAHDLAFPLRHPAHVVEDVAYRRRLYRTMGWGHPWLKAGRSLEELWLNLRAGRTERIRQALARRLAILCGRKRWD